MSDMSRSTPANRLLKATLSLVALGTAVALVTAASGVASTTPGNNLTRSLAARASVGARTAKLILGREKGRIVSPLLRREFAVFDHLRTTARRTTNAAPSSAGFTSAAPPPAVQAALTGGTGVSSLGLNPADGQSVQLRAGQVFWVVPGSGGACLTLDSPPYATGCAATSSGIDDGTFVFIGGQLGSAATSVSGVAPDGNTSVIINLANGGAVTTPVVDNVYSVTTATTPVSVSLINSAGQAVTSQLPSA